MTPQPTAEDREKAKELAYILVDDETLMIHTDLDGFEDAIAHALASCRAEARAEQREADAKVAYELPLNVDYCVEAIKRGSKDASDGFIYIGDMIAKAIRTGGGGSKNG